MHEVEKQYVTWVVGVLPKIRLPPVRFVPVTVTTVPPAAGPLVGVMAVTTGGGSDVVLV